MFLGGQRCFWHCTGSVSLFLGQTTTECMLTLSYITKINTKLRKQHCAAGRNGGQEFLFPRQLQWLIEKLIQRTATVQTLGC